MNKAKRTLLVVATAAAVALPTFNALADGHGREHRGMGHHGAKAAMLFERYDADGDRKVTEAEINTARQAQMKQFDADGNGTLTLNEYEALWLARMRERMVDAFQRLDADGDAVVTGDEFLRPAKRMMMMMDRDGDQAIAWDEVRRRGGMGRRGGEHGMRHRRHGQGGGPGQGPRRNRDDG